MSDDYNDENSQISVGEFAQQPFISDSNDSNNDKNFLTKITLLITSSQAIALEVKT